MTDRFFEYVGKGFLLFCAVFTLACAVLFVVDALNAMRQSEQPTFTVAPDSTRRKAK